jgi:type I restriction enzyme, S subunit
MNAERLLALYEKVAEAPDAIARLRRFVLDLAVRGKLVAQDAGDEPASELLKRITAEKARLVKAKAIRKPKALPPNDPDTWPFLLPKGWTWARVDELSPRSLTDGDWIETKDQSEDGGIRLIQLADVGVGAFLDKSSRFITAETEVRLNCTRLAVGDVLIARLPNPIGRACIFPDIGQPAITAVDVAILRPDSNVSSDFIVAAMNAPPTRDQIEAYGKGATRFRVSTGHLKTVLIPLPPLAEQRRIVAKVEELMALLDRLEAARTAREATRDRLTAASLARLTAPDADPAEFPANARFALATLPALTTRPDQIKPLRQTILNLAVRGKLVEQDPTDEPASELLKRVALAKGAANGRKGARARGVPAELEFTDTEVPAGWEPVRLEDVAVSMRYGTSIKCDYDEKLVPVLRIPNVSSGQVVLDDMKYGPLSEADREALSLKADDLLMIRSNGSLDIVGRAAVVPPEAGGMAFAGYLVRLQTLKEAINSRYVWLALNSGAVRDQIERPIRSAVGLKNVNLTEFGNLSFWLPPRAEQHRIVAKVDALMAICDRLDAALVSADTSRILLLEALLHEALAPAATLVTEAAE